MIAQSFKKAVSWLWFSPSEEIEKGRRLRERFDNFLANIFPSGRMGPLTEAEKQQFRQQIIEDEAARAVEWNWDKPDQMLDFIRSETPSTGRPHGIKPEDILHYAQQHFGELLPKRSDPAAQQELNDLRKRYNQPVQTLDFN